MLYKSFLHRAVTLQLTTNFVRSVSSSAPKMATPVQSFKLDRKIFNETLYTSIRDFWFAPLPDGATTFTEEAMSLWYGQNLSPEQQAAQDEDCRKKFEPALQAVSPEKLILPPFESHEKDLQQSSLLSKPFLEEVKNDQEQDEQKAADTLLSLCILLDQYTRNIYRDPAGLRLVFQHYDRIAHALIHSSMALDPNPIEHDCYRFRPAISQWYFLPLMHSEHLHSHHLYSEIVERKKRDVEQVNDPGAVDSWTRSLAFEKMHVEPLKKFGRYPHRNEALDRANSAEEEQYLEDAETFGVQQSQKKEKSEL